MRYLLLSLVAVSQIALAECDVRSASRLVSTRNVSQVLDLERTITKNKCTVNFKLEVDGDLHEVEETKVGNMPDGELCRLAIENGRKNLLTSLGGEFSAESTRICQTGFEISNTMKQGDIILETEAGTSISKKYFPHLTLPFQKCRMFQNRFVYNYKPKVYNGVICEVDKEKGFWQITNVW